MNDEYNKLLAKAVKATCGPSDLEQEAREVLDETGLTPREIYNELVILKERYTNQVGITEMEIACLVDDIQFKASLLKIAEKALEDIRKIVTDAQAKIEAENMDSTMYEIDFKDGQLYCQSGRNDIKERRE